MVTYNHYLKAVSQDRETYTKIYNDFGINAAIRQLTNKNGEFVKPRFFLGIPLNAGRFIKSAQELEASLLNLDAAAIHDPEINASLSRVNWTNAGLIMQLFRCVNTSRAKKNWRYWFEVGVCVLNTVLLFIKQRDGRK